MITCVHEAWNMRNVNATKSSTSYTKALEEETLRFVICSCSESSTNVERKAKKIALDDDMMPWTTT